MTDTGLSPQRTSLAWQRTSLSIATAACILARLRFEQVPVPTLLLCGTSLALSLWALAVGRRRTRAVPHGFRDGAVVAALACALALLALQELVVTASGAGR